VTDYLAEAFRALRKQNRFDEAEKAFRFGSHVEGRDATAVKKTVSGLLKILHPDGEWTKDELAEYVELALEGRRRPTKCEGPVGPHPNFGAKRHLRRSSGPVRESH